MGLPGKDVGERGIQSEPGERRYATYEARHRLHQERFRRDVLYAYSESCAVCRLRETALLQAAHIIEDRSPEGAALDGMALCAIHHLAYDRNVVGIDPSGVIHVAARLLNAIGGPMLRHGLQAFHGEAITMPRRVADRPDPERLELRYEQYKLSA